MSDIKQRIEEVKQKMGENYILHPQYKAKERHSFLTSLWYPQRTLRDVETRAREAGRL